MTTSLFKITPTPPTSIKLEPGQEGKFSFTVESLAAPDKVQEVILQALRVGEDGKGKEVDWLVVRPQQALSMSGGKTETVTISARPTPTTPRGEHSIKLVVAEKGQPNDVYADSPPVACEVVGPAVVAKPPPKFPRWLILAIVGGVLLVAGGIVLVVKLTGKESGVPGLGEACGSDAARACDEGLVCVTGVNKCLLAGGADCKPAQADLCASGECESKTEVCAIPLGGTCNPGDKDVLPCPRSSVCDSSTKTCLGNVSAPCKTDAECVTGKCTGNLCAMKAPAVNAGDPCEGTCPEPLQCSTVTKRCVKQSGQPCDSNNQCMTGLCEGAVCADAMPGRNCTKDGVCGPDQKCLEVQPGVKRCGWNPGHVCTTNAECTSQWCNQKTCSRDDGKCDSERDCPSPYVCIMAKRRCLLPIGAQCGGDVQCDSAFCNNNRCARSPCPPCPSNQHCNNNLAKPACVRNLFIVRDRALIPSKPVWTIQPGVH